jgi:hypothetical protein
MGLVSNTCILKACLKCSQKKQHNLTTCHIVAGKTGKKSIRIPSMNPIRTKIIVKLVFIVVLLDFYARRFGELIRFLL